MNICVFDTETTSLNNPFCYNIGYIIVNVEDWKSYIKRSYIIEQIWHNLPLFSTAYYTNKRPIYIEEMRARKTKMEKFGYVCQQMIRDFKNYEIENSFAFNSPFDEKVFNFNCDWFKCNNPFDNVSIKDIRGFAHNFLINNDYKKFCEENSYFTETGNYSTTAEIIYRWLFDNDFNEAHTALADAEIESKILQYCYMRGADLNKEYKTKIITRRIEKTLHLRTAEQIDYYFDYDKIRINKEKTEIQLS